MADCEGCLKLKNKLLKKSTILASKLRLLNSYKEGYKKIDFKKLNAKKYDKSSQCCLGRGTNQDELLMFHVSQNEKYSQEILELRVTISDYEKKLPFAEDQLKHIVFVNKQLVSYHLGLERILARQKNCLKSCANALLKYEGKNKKAQEILQFVSNLKNHSITQFMKTIDEEPNNVENTYGDFLERLKKVTSPAQSFTSDSGIGSENSDLLSVSSSSSGSNLKGAVTNASEKNDKLFSPASSCISQQDSLDFDDDIDHELLQHSTLLGTKRTCDTTAVDPQPNKSRLEKSGTSPSKGCSKTSSDENNALELALFSSEHNHFNAPSSSIENQEEINNYSKALEYFEFDNLLPPPSSDFDFANCSLLNFSSDQDESDLKNCPESSCIVGNEQLTNKNFEDNFVKQNQTIINEDHSSVNHDNYCQEKQETCKSADYKSTSSGERTEIKAIVNHSPQYKKSIFDNVSFIDSTGRPLATSAEVSPVNPSSNASVQRSNDSVIETSPQNITHCMKNKADATSPRLKIDSIKNKADPKIKSALKTLPKTPERIVDKISLTPCVSSSPSKKSKKCQSKNSNSPTRRSASVHFVDDVIIHSAANLPPLSKSKPKTLESQCKKILPGSKAIKFPVEAQLEKSSENPSRETILTEPNTTQKYTKESELRNITLPAADPVQICKSRKSCSSKMPLLDKSKDAAGSEECSSQESRAVLLEPGISSNILTSNKASKSLDTALHNLQTNRFVKVYETPNTLTSIVDRSNNYNIKYRQSSGNKKYADSFTFQSGPVFISPLNLTNTKNCSRGKPVGLNDNNVPDSTRIDGVFGAFSRKRISRNSLTKTVLKKPKLILNSLIEEKTPYAKAQKNNNQTNDWKAINSENRITPPTEYSRLSDCVDQGKRIYIGTETGLPKNYFSMKSMDCHQAYPASYFSEEWTADYATSPHHMQNYRFQMNNRSIRNPTVYGHHGCSVYISGTKASDYDDKPNYVLWRTWQDRKSAAQDLMGKKKIPLEPVFPQIPARNETMFIEEEMSKKLESALSLPKEETIETKRENYFFFNAISDLNLNTQSNHWTYTPNDQYQHKSRASSNISDSRSIQGISRILPVVAEKRLKHKQKEIIERNLFESANGTHKINVSDTKVIVGMSGNGLRLSNTPKPLSPCSSLKQTGITGNMNTDEHVVPGDGNFTKTKNVALGDSDSEGFSPGKLDLSARKSNNHSSVSKYIPDKAAIEVENNLGPNNCDVPAENSGEEINKSTTQISETHETASICNGTLSPSSDSEESIVKEYGEDLLTIDANRKKFKESPAKELIKPVLKSASVKITRNTKHLCEVFQTTSVKACESKKIAYSATQNSPKLADETTSKVGNNTEVLRTSTELGESISQNNVEIYGATIIGACEIEKPDELALLCDSLPINTSVCNEERLNSNKIFQKSKVNIEREETIEADSTEACEGEESIGPATVSSLQYVVDKGTKRCNSPKNLIAIDNISNHLSTNELSNSCQADKKKFFTLNPLFNKLDGTFLSENEKQLNSDVCKGNVAIKSQTLSCSAADSSSCKKDGDSHSIEAENSTDEEGSASKMIKVADVNSIDEETCINNFSSKRRVSHFSNPKKINLKNIKSKKIANKTGISSVKPVLSDHTNLEVNNPEKLPSGDEERITQKKLKVLLPFSCLRNDATIVDNSPSKADLLKIPEVTDFQSETIFKLPGKTSLHEKDKCMKSFEEIFNEYRGVELLSPLPSSPESCVNATEIIEEESSFKSPIAGDSSSCKKDRDSDSIEAENSTDEEGSASKMIKVADVNSIDEETCLNNFSSKRRVSHFSNPKKSNLKNIKSIANKTGISSAKPVLSDHTNLVVYNPEKLPSGDEERVTQKKLKVLLPFSGLRNDATIVDNSPSKADLIKIPEVTDVQSETIFKLPGKTSLHEKESCVNATEIIEEESSFKSPIAGDSSSCKKDRDSDSIEAENSTDEEGSASKMIKVADVNSIDEETCLNNFSSKRRVSHFSNPKKSNLKNINSIANKTGISSAKSVLSDHTNLVVYNPEKLPSGDEERVTQKKLKVLLPFSGMRNDATIVDNSPSKADLIKIPEVTNVQSEAIFKLPGKTSLHEKESCVNATEIIEEESSFKSPIAGDSSSCKKDRDSDSIEAENSTDEEGSASKMIKVADVNSIDEETCLNNFSSKRRVSHFSNPKKSNLKNIKSIANKTGISSAKPVLSDHTNLVVYNPEKLPSGDEERVTQKKLKVLLPFSGLRNDATIVDNSPSKADLIKIPEVTDVQSETIFKLLGKTSLHEKESCVNATEIIEEESSFKSPIAGDSSSCKKDRDSDSIEAENSTDEEGSASKMIQVADVNSIDEETCLNNFSSKRRVSHFSNPKKSNLKNIKSIAKKTGISSAKSVLSDHTNLVVYNPEKLPSGDEERVTQKKLKVLLPFSGMRNNATIVDNSPSKADLIKIPEVTDVQSEAIFKLLGKTSLHEKESCVNATEIIEEESGFKSAIDSEVSEQEDNTGEVGMSTSEPAHNGNLDEKEIFSKKNKRKKSTNQSSSDINMRPKNVQELLDLKQSKNCEGTVHQTVLEESICKGISITSKVESQGFSKCTEKNSIFDHDILQGKIEESNLKAKNNRQSNQNAIKDRTKATLKTLLPTDRKSHLRKHSVIGINDIDKPFRLEESNNEPIKITERSFSTSNSMSSFNKSTEKLYSCKNKPENNKVDHSSSENILGCNGKAAEAPIKEIKNSFMSVSESNLETCKSYSKNPVPSASETCKLSNPLSKTLNDELDAEDKEIAVDTIHNVGILNRTPLRVYLGKRSSSVTQDIKKEAPAAPKDSNYVPHMHRIPQTVPIYSKVIKKPNSNEKKSIGPLIASTEEVKLENTIPDTKISNLKEEENMKPEVNDIPVLQGFYKDLSKSSEPTEEEKCITPKLEESSKELNNSLHGIHYNPINNDQDYQNSSFFKRKIFDDPLLVNSLIDEEPKFKLQKMEIPEPKAELIECSENLLHTSLEYFMSNASSEKPEKTNEDMTLENDILLQDINKVLSTSSENVFLVTNRVISALKNSKLLVYPKQFSRAIHQTLLHDTGPVVDQKPYMNKNTLACTIFTMAYIGENVNDFLLEVLRDFEETLGAYHDKSLTLGMAVRCSAYHTALCKAYDLESRVKHVMYDVLYSRQAKAYGIILKILQIWPELLVSQNAFMNEDCPLTLTILSILLTTSIDYRTIAKSHADAYQKAYNSKKLKEFLKLTYMHKPSDYTICKVDLFDKITLGILQEGSMKALVLLCHCQGPEWTKPLLEKKLFCILQNWIEGKVPNDVAQHILITSAMIIRGLPIGPSVIFVQQALDLYEKILHKSPDEYFTEKVIESIGLLRRHNLILCARIFINFTPFSKNVTKKSMDYVRKILATQDIGFWVKFYDIHRKKKP